MSNVFTTSDLALAAYLLTKGRRLIVAEKSSSGRYHFEIEDDVSQGFSLCNRLKIEFVNSEFIKFDNNLKMLKKMIYS